MNIFCIFLFFFFFSFFFLCVLLRVDCGTANNDVESGTEYGGKMVRVSKRTNFQIYIYIYKYFRHILGKSILFSSFFKCLVNDFTHLSCCIIKIDILGNRKTVLKKSQVTLGYIKINEYAEFLISSLSLLFACPECL